jgi:CubicO group peptidase (beta-lactamase class C family)
MPDDPRPLLPLRLARRGLLAGVALAALAALAGDGPGRARVRFAPARQLTALADPAPAAQLADVIGGYLLPTPDHPGHPSYPGAVAAVALDGALVGPVAVGYAVRYADAAIELPADQCVPATPDTVYDLASLTKLFTTVLALRLVEQRALDLDRPVQAYLPGFTGAGKGRVTCRMLLQHLSGLPGDVDLVHGPPGPVEAYLLATPLAHRPGRAYVYSDVGMATLGLVLARVGGAPLERLLREQVTGVLGLSDTGYRPLSGGAVDLDRIAATEAQPWVGRPMLRGQVHDEMAYALGGVSGHAGLFGSARDLAVFGQALLCGGWYGQTRLLSPRTLAAALLPGTVSPYGLGFELDQESFMGPLAGPLTFGHTGFTGTSLVVDLRRRAVVVLLSNRVHPTRAWGPDNAARRRVARLARAWRDTPGKPPSGGNSVSDRNRAQLPVTLDEAG